MSVTKSQILLRKILNVKNERDISRYHGSDWRNSAIWFSQNGDEAGKPYAIRTIVYHKKNKVWQSKVENNNIEPVAGNAWAELKADITANEVGAYNKAEADKRFQPLGNYTPSGYSYSKGRNRHQISAKG